MKNRKAVHFKALTGFIWLCLCAVLLFGTASPAFSEITGRMILSIKDNAEIMSRLKNGDEITISLYRLAGRTRHNNAARSKRPLPFFPKGDKQPRRPL